MHKVLPCTWMLLSKVSTEGSFATDELIPNVQFLILLRPEPMNELMGF